MMNLCLGNMPYLAGFAIFVGLLLLGGFSTLCWYQCQSKNLPEPEPDYSFPSPLDHQIRPAVGADVDPVHRAGQIDGQSSSMNRPSNGRLAVGLITVTTFGPSEIVDTELW